MKITKEGRHDYSKKRRKMVRKGLNPYDDKLLTNLDKEWAQLRFRIGSIKHISCGTIVLMQDFEDIYYRELEIDTDLDKIMYEINILKRAITDPILSKELETIISNLSTTKDGLIDYMDLKRLIVRLQSKLDITPHFYAALDDEYQEVYQEVMNDSFKVR